MIHQQILEKAISKAQNNGFNHMGWKLITGEEATNDVLKWNEDDWLQFLSDNQYFTLIFSRDFAQALWGEEMDESKEYYIQQTSGYDTYNGKAYWDGPNWQYHLQQMVIAEDPIKYLGKNI